VSNEPEKSGGGEASVDVSSAPPTENSHNGPLGVEARLLGPFEVALAGRVVHIGSPKQRAVLALLALQAGRVVTSDALCDLVWDENQPASPSATLQSLISRLRRTLGAASGGSVETGSEILRSREPGWVLDIAPAAVDALRFQELTARARLRSGRGEATAAAADLAAAIGLWRGEALVDVVDAGYLAAQATRLNEARLDAVEDLAEAELAGGRPADALARLEAHVEANPLRERAWGLLITALYRLGRQAAALGTFQQVRTLLREELGLEPSPELVQIEQQILRHDPALAGPRSTPAHAGPPPPTEAPGAQSSEFANYSVVVVEDHDFQRRTVVQLLRGLGVGTVKDAADGVEALRILEAAPIPDVVICDIDMPGMDGVEFVTRVAESNLACSVVIASGLESNVLRAVEAIGEGHGLHVLAALQKPLTSRRLGEVLRQYTGLHRGRADAPGGTALSRQQVRDALENGGLRAAFEPRIDLTTGAFSSAEAGARWHAPDGTPIPASLVAPALADDEILLVFVERLVAASVLLLNEVGRAGLDVGGPVRLAVNVSPLLSDTSLADRLDKMVRSRGQDPRHFVCQLDDVALARAPATALAVLTRLRVKGFGLSMAYSGMGPSWTQQLGRVPLTELKLVRRLVSAATSEPKRFQVLEATLAAARDAELPVVADGCDAQADFDMLLALGCSEAQGQWVARPMEAAEVVAWAQTGPRPYEPGVPG
jgi:DNA-binding SARP family transcriptional activator/EAL domain-containing protein (putative c-di-GMP-specific phosphodiesterase class I)/FixJ family two-component response regulator